MNTTPNEVIEAVRQILRDTVTVDENSVLDITTDCVPRLLTALRTATAQHAPTPPKDWAEGEQLLNELQAAGSMGLDGSPGNALARRAHDAIVYLSSLLAQHAPTQGGDWAEANLAAFNQWRKEAEAVNMFSPEEAWGAGIEFARRHAPQPDLASVRAGWRVAITLANNICCQNSDRLNGEDRTEEAYAASDCAKRIRGYIDPADEQLREMLAEAGVTVALAPLLGANEDREDEEAYWRGYRARLDETTTELPEPKNPTLWRYLQNAFEKQITFHTIGVNRMPDGGFHFYIHPQSVSGDTEDYLVWPDPFNWHDMLANKKDIPEPDVEKLKAAMRKYAHDPEGDKLS